MPLADYCCRDIRNRSDSTSQIEWDARCYRSVLALPLTFLERTVTRPDWRQQSEQKLLAVSSEEAPERASFSTATDGRP
jgi:hypothetical protein